MERLQLADLYIIRPDGSGLKKITKSGEFCGGPKWKGASRVIAYCMTGEQTLANRRVAPEPGNDTRLVSIDTANGTSTDLPASPGVKIAPRLWPRTKSDSSRRIPRRRVFTIRAAGVGRVAPFVPPPGRPMERKWSLPDVLPWRGRHGVAHSAAIRITNYFRLEGSPAFSPSGNEFVTVTGSSAILAQL